MLHPSSPPGRPAPNAQRCKTRTNLIYYRSWHPSLLRNQERVWSEEKRALEERKRIDQLHREREEERQIQELQKLQEASGKPKQHQQRVDWMYQAPSTSTGHYSEEMEGYLLGKRRIDTILLKNEEKSNNHNKLDNGAGQQPTNNILSARDTMSKIRSDPLLEVKKREQDAYEAVVQETIRRQRRAEMREMKERQSSRRGKDRDDEHSSRRNHHHHRHHHRRHHSRSRSPPRRQSSSTRDISVDRHRYKDDRYRRGDYYRRDDSRRDSYHRRQRSRSSSSPSYDQLRYNANRRSDYEDHGRRDSRRHEYSDRRDKPWDREAEEKERQRKLAEMQSNAQEMEDVRRHRVDKVSAMEEQQRHADDRRRTDRGQFMSQLHRRAQEDSLDERIRRNRGGLARVEDD